MNISSGSRLLTSKGREAFWGLARLHWGRYGASKRSEVPASSTVAEASFNEREPATFFNKAITRWKMAFSQNGCRVSGKIAKLIVMNKSRSKFCLISPFSLLTCEFKTFFGYHNKIRKQMIHYFKILFFFFRASKIIVNSNNRAINILKRFGTCLRYSIIEYYSSS